MAKKKSPSSRTESDAGDAIPGVPPDRPAAGEQTAAPYVVLARKYRPETLDQLIGQEAMVRTLRNAFAIDRIAQAYMLTGVRGVGKTTTARILARALNYAKPGLPDRPTADMDGYGDHCIQIIQSRHPDVLEMDAASNTGVDNIRELIESARYTPLAARFRVFIIDEVHMLSKGAFNALLKTLEEPPPHVKFIFATTEIRKVPVTVLSRCQRFDLKRVDVVELAQHLRGIAQQEGVEAEDAALTAIARAAGGSVRDGLSLLDQAIAMASGKVTASATRAMLGLTDRGRVFDLLEVVLRGDAKAALDAFRQINLDGADPAQVLTDLADVVHAATRAKVAGEAAAGEHLSAEEKRRAGSLSEKLSVAILSRAWQMLLKGLDDTASAPDPLAAAEMVLVRLAYTADLPPPAEVVRALADGRAVSAASIGRPVRDERANAPADATQGSGVSAALPARPDFAPPLQAESKPNVASFKDVIALVSERRDAKLKVHLEEYVRLVRFEPGQIEMRLLDGAPAGIANELIEKLTRWTGRRWIVVLSREEGEPSIGEMRRKQEADERADLEAHPAVAAVLKEFPDAVIRNVRPLRRAGTTDDGTI